nr:MAG: phosphoprotein [Wufeng shrew rhabdovirus 6]
MKKTTTYNDNFNTMASLLSIVGDVLKEWKLLESSGGSIWGTTGWWAMLTTAKTLHPAGRTNPVSLIDLIVAQAYEEGRTLLLKIKDNLAIYCGTQQIWKEIRDNFSPGPEELNNLIESQIKELKENIWKCGIHTTHLDTSYGHSEQVIAAAVDYMNLINPGMTAQGQPQKHAGLQDVILQMYRRELTNSSDFIRWMYPYTISPAALRATIFDYLRHKEPKLKMSRIQEEDDNTIEYARTIVNNIKEDDSGRIYNKPQPSLTQLFPNQLKDDIVKLYMRSRSGKSRVTVVAGVSVPDVIAFDRELEKMGMSDVKTNLTNIARIVPGFKGIFTRSWRLNRNRTLKSASAMNTLYKTNYLKTHISHDPAAKIMLKDMYGKWHH